MNKENKQESPSVSDSTEDIIVKISNIVGCPFDGGLILAYGNWIDPTLDTLRAKAWCFDLLIQYNLVLESIRGYYKVRDNRESILSGNENWNLAIMEAVVVQEYSSE
jgi:hypothetical protein